MKYISRALLFIGNLLAEFMFFLLKSQANEIKKTAMNIANEYVKSTKNGIDDKALESFVLFIDKKKKELPFFMLSEVEKKVNDMKLGVVKDLKIDTKNGVSVELPFVKASWNPLDGSGSISVVKNIK